MEKYVGEIKDENKKVVALKLLDEIGNSFDGVDGHIYLGYPYIVDSYTNLEEIVDITFISRKGVFFFDILTEEISDYDKIQDKIYNNIYSKFLRNNKLLNGRNLKIDINVASYTEIKMCEKDGFPLLKNAKEIMDYIKEKSKEIDEITFDSILYSVQEAYGLNTNKERPNAKVGTKAFQIGVMSNKIGYYDDSQMEAILADPKGIQRIRGMAGSGKTIVLAKKAAELHKQHPDWNIAVTYYTRSLNGQLEDFIDRFYSYENNGKKYDKNKLHIMHAWGSNAKHGLYYEMCMRTGVKPLNYREAQTFEDQKSPFENACKKLLDADVEIEPCYDCILIDEAQDFGKYFLNMCLKALDRNKRLIYAYDELQQLDGEAMEKPIKLFGRDIEHDTPLKICYRNQSSVIVTAHAIGMGLYSKNGLIQMPGSSDVWEAIGYCSSSEIKEGSEVTLYRTKETSPDLLESTNDIIDFISCTNKDSMDLALIDMINRNLTEDGLEYRDLMIIDMDTLHNNLNKNELLKMIDAINSNKQTYNFSLHSAGASYPEDFFRNDSIVYSTIRRAKGNEAFFVYVVNAQKCINSWQKRSDRNSLFTAITRSKGWVRVLGYGEEMNELLTEFNVIKDNNYKLHFEKYPTKEEQETIFLNNEDLGDDQVRKIRDVSSYVKSFNDGRKEMLLKELFKLNDNDAKKIMSILNKEE